MHALRTSSILARLVLALFVLMLGTAIASPIVHPTKTEMVCTTGGVMKMVVTSEDGQTLELGQHTLDCSLCLPAGLPAVPPVISFALPQPLAHALRPEVAAHIAALVGAPLPPRGPPTLI